ncbi:MAG: septum formation initiator family protein [Oscillospiraceae bacterium]|nr:septum formation initiator family protein [Oscillospiraceae bacterium]
MPKLILAVFVIYATGVLISNQVKINRLESSTAELDELIATEEIKKAQLEQALSDEIDDDYVTKEAQSQGYAAPNERVFVDVSGS